jgi:DNA-binding FrmR family transcriptional regulator
MQIRDDVVSDVRKRLRRAAGQVQAVERPDEAEAEGYALPDVERMFMKLT